MRITTEFIAGLLEIRVAGRFDNESVDEFDAAVSELLREGHHAAVVDLREVEFISSAGLGTLVRSYKRFQAIQGAFGVGAASTQAAEVIRMTGLARLLLCDPDEIRVRFGGGRTTIGSAYSIAATDQLEMMIYDLAPSARQTCHVWGDPTRLATSGYDAAQCREVALDKNMLGFGLGALGADFGSCREQFGEFVAVGGGVMVQPTPGGKPDYQNATGQFVPRPQVLYGASSGGEFARMVRFNAAAGRRHIDFSHAVEQCLLQSPAEISTLVFVAESAGLVGAGLRHSPAAASVGRGADLSYPGIREWLSFTPDHTHAHTLTIIVGIAAKNAPSGGAAALGPLLRPMNGKSAIQGHFHAAVFPYRPLKRRKLDLLETTNALFESEDLQAVLHLLHDDRTISGGGESRLTGGACWIGPIGDVIREGR